MSDQELNRFEASRSARVRAGQLALLSIAVTWLPLFVLAIVDGVAWGEGVRVPLVKDFLAYGQFLISVPVLIIGEMALGKRLRLAAEELRRSDVVAPEDTPKLNAMLARALSLWSGRGVTAVILVAALLVTTLSFLRAREWLTGTWQYDGERITLPGWWYLIVSLTVMRYLAAQWLWRLLLWAWVLWRTARLRLRPQPVHPDRAGGLAFLGGTQAAFGALVFAFGVQLSCLAADAVTHGGADLMAYKGHVVAYVLFVLILLLTPLLVFLPALARAREEYLLFLSGSGYRAAAYLDRKLRESKEGELPTDDVSGLTDFGPLYENARLMQLVPLELRHVIAIVLAALVPFVPLVFLVMPAKDVFRSLAKLLL